MLLRLIRKRIIFEMGHPFYSYFDKTLVQDLNNDIFLNAIKGEKSSTQSLMAAFPLMCHIEPSFVL